MLLFISLIILSVLAAAAVTIYFRDDYDSRAFGVTISFFILIVIALIIIQIFIQIQTPTAMDVYQGKTTLEITYKDGVPVDSVVVWKSKQ